MTKKTKILIAGILALLVIASIIFAVSRAGTPSAGNEEMMESTNASADVTADGMTDGTDDGIVDGTADVTADGMAGGAADGTTDGKANAGHGKIEDNPITDDHAQAATESPDLKLPEVIASDDKQDMSAGDGGNNGKSKTGQSGEKDSNASESNASETNKEDSDNDDKGSDHASDPGQESSSIYIDEDGNIILPEIP